MDIPTWWDCARRVRELERHPTTWVYDLIEEVDWPWRMDGYSHALVEIVIHALYWPRQRPVCAPFEFRPCHVRSAHLLGLAGFQVNYMYRAWYVLTRQYVLGLPAIANVTTDHMDRVPPWSLDLQREWMDMLCAQNNPDVVRWLYTWIVEGAYASCSYEVRVKKAKQLVHAKRVDPCILRFSGHVYDTLRNIAKRAPYPTGTVHVGVLERGSMLSVTIQSESVEADGDAERAPTASV